MDDTYNIYIYIYSIVIFLKGKLLISQGVVV